MTDIKKALEDLVEENFQFTKGINWKQVEDVPLVKPPFSFDGISLFYLLMLVEEKFNIIFIVEDFRENLEIFYTISKIETAIRKKIKILGL